MKTIVPGPLPRTIWKRNSARILARRCLATEAFIRGPTDTPLLEMTVGDHFRGIVREHGNRTAIISQHQKAKLSYEQLHRDSDQLARGLQKLGVNKGDRCCVSLGNNIEFATLTYALFKLGAILVPLNPAFNTTQVASALSHLAAKHLIISSETNRPRKPPRSNIPMLQELIPRIKDSSYRDALHSEAIPCVQNVIVVENSDGRIDRDLHIPATLKYEDVFADGGSSHHDFEAAEKLNSNEIVNIQFTSGTTSMPKAACLTHRNILNNGKSIGDRMLLTPQDIVCCPPPLFHCFGCILGYMATATHGSAIAFPSESFDPLATLQTVRDHACTALYGVPTMFIAELDLLTSGAVPRTGLSQLRTGIAAGSSIPAELMRRLHRELHLTELTICYGMTETSPVSAQTTTDDPIEKRVNTVGRVLPHVNVKIVDPLDKTKTLAVGQKGELAINGYLVMKGYWGDKQKTDEVMIADKDGEVWMHTGDEALIDKDGYVSITGRIKDLIIRGGENIHPLEVENSLLAHPRISQASVLGLPDARYGEVVAAFIDPKGDEEQDRSPLTTAEVRNWVLNHLSHHLVPKYVFWVDDFPKTASGKIQKFKLRELGQELIKQGQGL